MREEQYEKFLGCVFELVNVSEMVVQMYVVLCVWWGFNINQLVVEYWVLCVSVLWLWIDVCYLVLFDMGDMICFNEVID